VKRNHFFSLLAVLTFLFCACATPPSYWPGETWRTSSPEEQGMDSSTITSLLDTLKTYRIPVHSVLIVKNGYLVTEAYFYPYQRNDRQDIHSCTKSVTSALIGIALNEGRIRSLDEKVLGFFPEYKFENPSPWKNEMTIRDLLSMTAGIEWNEGRYDRNDDSTRMLAGDNAIGYCLNKTMASKPGSVFTYNSGASHTLSAILQKETNRKTIDYAREKLFAPLGIDDIFWATDKQGINFGGGDLLMRPIDMAKFGYLYLRKGDWNGRQIVPASWVEDSTKVHVKEPGFGYSYGYQWWIPDTNNWFEARGYGGQYIMVIPKYDLVIALTSWIDNTQAIYLVSQMKNLIKPLLTSNEVKKTPDNNSRMLIEKIAEVASPPPPETVPQAPEIAKKISGRTINTGDGVSFCFTFGKGNECDAEMYAGGVTTKMKIGLDGVFRMSEAPPILIDGSLFSGGSRVALKGEWMDKMTFRIYGEELGIFNIEYRFTFTGSDVSVWNAIDYLNGNLFEQTRKGTLSPPPKVMEGR
jgi:CubicO group peptidase (beta-lactamase class C family)